MLDRRLAYSTARRISGTAHQRPRGLPNVYRGGTRRTLRDIYEADHAESRTGGRFRWLVSTCLAAAVGAVAIFVVIYGSADRKPGGEDFLPDFKPLLEDTEQALLSPQPRRSEGLNWAVPRSDRLQITIGSTSTRFLIHETVKQRRGGREYIQAKPYLRIAARLSGVTPRYADEIPPFNPLKLYANSQPIRSDEDDDGVVAPRSDVSVKVVELLGGILPGEDGQELDSREVADIVERAKEAEAEAEAEAKQLAENPGFGAVEAGADQSSSPKEEPAPPNTTVAAKSHENDIGLDELEGAEVRVVKVGRGDTLTKILTKTGADTWHARAMVEAARGIFPESLLAPGHEVRITLVPSLTQQNRMEPARFSVFSDGHEHKVTVTRNEAGEFVARGTPFDDKKLALESLGDSDRTQSASLYSSVYQASLMQHVPSETILQIMRIHAYETDFRRRLRAGDAIELFFDVKEDAGPDAPPGELLYSSINAGGDVTRFYRFRTPDGVVDYYDDQGNNSKKFLMRRPVRAQDIRLTSGFGVRFHPLLNERKMHTGVDWAAPPGTPVLAAGSGVTEEAGRKGQYGNYIRIRHANGYHTAYGHMIRLSDGVAPGVKVRQGQIIGFVGATGMASGPHLHYEVLVNTRFVDPLSIQVPRERKLSGKQLAEFQKERARIDDLMRRAPVMVESRGAEATQASAADLRKTR